MKIFIIVLFFLSLFLTCCKNGRERPDSLKLIDIESGINNMEIVNLSQFTDNIRYVPFETDENLPLVNIVINDVLDSLILIQRCIIYNIQGQFIRKISSKGRGPGEYQYYSNGCFGYNQNIFFRDLFDLLEFKLDGTFINRYKNTFLYDSIDLKGREFIPISDSLFFGQFGVIRNDIQEFKAIIFNRKGEIKYSYISNESFPGVKSMYINPNAHFYLYNQKLFYKTLFDDTLFYLNDHYDLIPQFVFDVGKFRQPRSTMVKGKSNKYIFIRKVFQTGDFLFFKCDFGDHFPAKRLTPFMPPIFMAGAEPSWYNTRDVLGIYNIKDGRLIFSAPTSTDNRLFTTGFYNDIDAGPRFFPENMINDSTMVMCINAQLFKDHIASDDFKNNIPKYPEKKKKLEELAVSISEFDNGIMMVVTFNKRTE